MKEDGGWRSFRGSSRKIGERRGEKLFFCLSGDLELLLGYWEAFPHLIREVERKRGLAESEVFSRKGEH